MSLHGVPVPAILLALVAWMCPLPAAALPVGKSHTARLLAAHGTPATDVPSAPRPVRIQPLHERGAHFAPMFDGVLPGVPSPVAGRVFSFGPPPGRPSLAAFDTPGVAPGYRAGNDRVPSQDDPTSLMPLWHSDSLAMVAVVPAPSSLPALAGALGIGLLALGWRSRRRTG